MSIRVGNTQNVYTYDDRGNMLSTISFSGEGNLNNAYLCAESLEALKTRKTSTYDIRKLLSSEKIDILQLVYYQYSDKKLRKMVTYGSDYGIQKTSVTYDGLNRIASVYNKYVRDGLTIEYSYKGNLNRIVKRKERKLSECFVRGCFETEIIETYSYNASDSISKIHHISHYFDNDGELGAGADTAVEKIFQYR